MIASTPASLSRASLLRVTAAVLAWGAVSLGYAQNAPAPAADPGKDQPVVLPNFEITETPANPYLSKQALSGTRVAMAIQDIPQTVSIVTSDFIKDTGSQRMLDAAKYITPVVESTIPVGADRYTIRGFQVSHEFIDGMVISGEDGYSASIAPYNIDRIEIIKGPNAILVPGGAPGGQFNPITKSPMMKNQASATVDLAQYLGTAFSTDINRVVSQEKGIAVRLVAAIWDSNGFYKNSYRRGYEIAPSFSWQLSPTSKLTIKAEFMQNRESQTPNLPLDPSIGSDDYAKIATGLPANWSFGSEQDNRHRRTDRITGELFTTLNDHVTARLQLSADHILRNDQGGTSASIFVPDPTTGALVAFNPTRNPYTGKYEPGVVWTVDNSGPTAVATLTKVALPNPSTYVYRRINGSDHLYYNEMHLRKDYAGKFDNEIVPTVGRDPEGRKRPISTDQCFRPDASLEALSKLSPAFNPAGGSVTVRVEPGRLLVVDTGPGIDPGDVPRAFERFYLYDKASRDRRVGSGLGLAIVRQLAAAMGGRAWVETAPGRGATFGVELPVCAPPPRLVALN